MAERDALPSQSISSGHQHESSEAFQRCTLLNLLPPSSLPFIVPSTSAAPGTEPQRIMHKLITIQTKVALAFGASVAA